MTRSQAESKLLQIFGITNLRLVVLAISALLLSYNTNAKVVYTKNVTDYVDPKIGTDGRGHTFIGPCCPYGMVKPGPDCGPSSNSGWWPLNSNIFGFSQVHVSGTGGGPKYGNILIQPYLGAPADGLTAPAARHPAMRVREDAKLGYYATTYDNGIEVEVTTSEKASVYRIKYPENGSLQVDLDWYLSKHNKSPLESQYFVKDFVAIGGDRVFGYQTIRGGWNIGKPYTVYFSLHSDVPFSQSSLAKAAEGQQANVSFNSKEVNITVGISFLSVEKAEENAQAVLSKGFDKVYEECVAKWDKQLSKIEIDDSTPADQKRMFYTGLYRNMLMPVDRTGEWAPAGDSTYYDDYYAIWDTFRTTTPLVTLLDPDREVEIVNSLLNIYKIDGYLPDARSGNSNGRTQGGSNAEVVLSDAFVKGLKGIDYELALEAMIHDAEDVPADDAMEGRGGLESYNTLGYVPWGISREGTRTMEYANDDYSIYLVAEGLGKKELAQKYLVRSGNWKNLWRADYENGGVKGFIMPRGENGEWLTDFILGSDGNFIYPQPRLETMKTFRNYQYGWATFFYEANAWEYSLSVPHDVPGLIELCGGKEAFVERLDKFFDGGYYNVTNEPSFLTSCLYSWAGHPEKTSARTLQIIKESFSDAQNGLPGNDDSGAMSGWLVWHMMGIYPVAGQNLYVAHTPLLDHVRIHLPNGRTLVVNKSDFPKYKKTFLTHEDLLKGGKLVL